MLYLKRKTKKKKKERERENDQNCQLINSYKNLYPGNHFIFISYHSNVPCIFHHWTFAHNAFYVPPVSFHHN